MIRPKLADSFALNQRNEEMPFDTAQEEDDQTLISHSGRRLGKLEELLDIFRIAQSKRRDQAGG
jgi:hypothetical protein